MICPPISSPQGVYALVVYFCISWHTLSRKHKKYGIGDDVEPLTVPGEPDYLGSMSTLASSRQHLVPEVGSSSLVLRRSNVATCMIVCMYCGTGRQHLVPEVGSSSLVLRRSL